LHELWIAEPWIQHFTHAGQHRADGASGRAHQIDVFRIAQWLWEVQLVECGSAANAQLRFQKLIGKQGHHRAADDEVLFDLPLFGPRCSLRPCDNIEAGNHSSISG
jgi:hypothetical protein